MCIRHVCDVHNEFLMYICDVRIWWVSNVHILRIKCVCHWYLQFLSKCCDKPQSWHVVHHRCPPYNVLQQGSHGIKYGETSLIRHSMGPENNVGLGGCWTMECLLPYLCMVTVPHIMVGLKRMLDYIGVGLARFHCITFPSESGADFPLTQLAKIVSLNCILFKEAIGGNKLVKTVAATILVLGVGHVPMYIL